MTSTRLPGKVLKTINGKTLLQYHLQRLQQSLYPVMVATTVNQTDDPIVDACEKYGIPFHRGSEHDVLSRYFDAALKFDLDVIVRVTSDCPLVDGELIQRSVQHHLSAFTPWLYTSNCIERTYPRGFDFEIFSFEMLKEAYNLAKSTPEREHVTPYIHQNKHGKTRFQHITRQPDMSSYRLTVDEPDDFRLMETLIQQYRCDQMNEEQIAQVLLAHPELKEINQHIEQKKT